MRGLSVVAMLLGHFRCMLQTARGRRYLLLPEADSQPAGSAPAHAPASTAPHTFSQSPWSPGAQTTTW